MSKARGPYRVDPLGYKKANEALDKKAENARELGLDYEPAQQEPVAWIVEDQSGERLEWASDAHSCHGVPTFPLYTSPPAQRKPLTDEEIIASNYPDGEENGPTIAAPDFELICFARQIEAAHGIKEKNT